VHFPGRADAALRAIEACHGGKAYDSAYHSRMRGRGVIAELIARRFEIARRRHGLDAPLPPLDTQQFRVPAERQPDLF
jgi:hypothetical protein